MRFQSLLSAILCCVVACSNTEGSLTEPGPVDFETEIIPVLTRFGCNAGACHGAATGRGNFKLSLFGSRPHEDYQAIVHHLEGRRIHPAQAERSLLLQKPSGAVDHGGGIRFSENERPYELLSRWIQLGAPQAPTRAFQELKISVEPSGGGSAESARQLRAVAMFDTGIQEVTELTTFTPEDPVNVRIDPQGHTVLLRPGRHLIIARYLNKVVPVEIIDPMSTAEFEPLDGTTDNPTDKHRIIDAMIRNRLRSMQIQPAPQVSDRAWFRRISLDLTGRLPNWADLHRLTPESALDPGSMLDRVAVVDELLSSPEFADFWSFQLSRMWQLNSVGNADAAASSRQWIRTQIERDAPLSEMIRTMLTAEGNPVSYGPAAFHLVRNDARSQAEYVSETLAGIRLRCANCHDHPLDRWTQDDYHGLAAVFADLSRGDEIRRTGRGSVIHPGTGLPAIRSIPGQSDFRTTNLQPASSISCNDVADWLLNPNEAVFARNFVNRVWALLNGRGLAHPVDDLRVTNPPIHSAVLDELTREFVDGGYRLRPLIRTICLTETYSRSESDDVMLQTVPGLFAESQRLPLMPEVLLDAICDVTGIPENYDGYEPGTRAAQLTSVRHETEALRLLRQDSSDASGVLALINGPVLNNKLSDPKSFLSGILDNTEVVDAFEERIQKIYVRTLLRQPTTAELQFWKEQCLQVNESADGDAKELRRLLEDLMWSLMISDEFTR